MHYKEEHGYEQKFKEKFLDGKSSVILLSRKLSVAVKHWDVNAVSESVGDLSFLSLHIKKSEEADGGCACN